MQSGESKLAEPLQRIVLQRQFLQPRKPAEGERWDPSNGIPIQVQLPDGSISMESIRLQMTDRILRQGEVLYSRRKIFRDSSQISSITQHLVK